MALILITHDMGVVAETARAGRGAVCRPEGRGAAGARAVRRPRTIPIPRRCWRRCPNARPNGGCRRSRASCPASSTGPTGCLFSPRCPFADERLPQQPAAAEAPTLGLARCHYPLNDRRGSRSGCQHGASARRQPGDEPDRQGRRTRRRGRGRPWPDPHYAVGGGLFAKADGAGRSPRRASRCTPGKTLAVVGESGCGKSTLARLVTMIERADRRHAAIWTANPATPRRPGPRCAHRADRLPGSLRLAQPAPAGRRDPRGTAEDQPPPDVRQRTPEQGPRDAGASSACAPSITTAIRTCSPAASASASRSPAR